MIDWSPKTRIEAAYRDALHNLIDRFVLMLPGLDLTNPYEIVSSLNRYAITDVFQEFAHAAASRMVLGLFVDQGRTWREAARESMQGRMIYEALRRELDGPVGFRVSNIVEENARLISTFPLKLSHDVNSFIAREAQKGRRSENIARDLVKQFPDVSRNRINLIARTETSKASTALTRSRSEDMGLDWYTWTTSKDARVRHSHEHLDRVLISWVDPPAPEALVGIRSKLGKYHAGEAPNCRCFPAPVINLNLIRWPAKIYTGGRIVWMTRHQFEAMNESGLKRAA